MLLISRLIEPWSQVDEISNYHFYLDLNYYWEREVIKCDTLGMIKSRQEVHKLSWADVLH